MATKKATKQLPLFPASKQKTKQAKPKKRRAKQTGKSNFFYDVFFKALPPGKRISKKTGEPYYEYRKNRSDKPGQLTGIGTMDYFDVRNIQSLDQLKKEYYKLAKKHHPDAGGSEAAFKALQAEYEELTNNYLKYGNFTNKEKQVEVEIDERYMAVVNEIMRIPGIDVEIVGSWIWVGGLTYPVKDELKKLGFMFAPLKKMWYINTTGTKTKKGKEMDIESIRKKYGTKKFSRDGGSYIEGINGLVKISPLQKRKFKLAMSKLIKALQKRKPSANG